MAADRKESAVPGWLYLLMYALLVATAIGGGLLQLRINARRQELLRTESLTRDLEHASYVLQTTAPSDPRLEGEGLEVIEQVSQRLTPDFHSYQVLLWSRVGSLRAALKDPEASASLRTDRRTDLLVAARQADEALQAEEDQLELLLNEDQDTTWWIALCAVALASLASWQTWRAMSAIRAAEQMRQEVEQALAEAQQARDAAGRASNAKSEFLATVSHEIRTPMMAVLGTAELMQATELSGRQRDHLDVIRHAGEALLQLINNVLDISQIEAGRLELDPEDFEPEELFSSVMLIFAGLASARSIDLRLLLPANLPGLLRSDRRRLRQVLVNLIGNALKFTQVGRVSVVVSWSPEAEQLTVEVVDTGPGLPPGAESRLFTPFVQGDPQAARVQAGSGLGLAISKRLVEALGGEIRVVSRPGMGCTFSFWISAQAQLPPLPAPEVEKIWVLGTGEVAEGVVQQLGRWGLPQQWVLRPPLEAGPEDTLILAPAEQVPVGWAGPVIFLGGPQGEEGLHAEPLLAWPPVARQLRRALLNESNTEWEPPNAEAGCLVLAVDDNHINRMVVGEMLRALGCEVEEAPDGPSALDHPRLSEVELIFMDVDMPVLNGIETTRLLRQRGLLCPIVGLTGHATESVMEEAREAGMSHCLTKPTGLEQLRKVLQGRGASAASA